MFNTLIERFKVHYSALSLRIHLSSKNKKFKSFASFVIFSVFNKIFLWANNLFYCSKFVKLHDCIFTMEKKIVEQENARARKTRKFNLMEYCFNARGY